MNRKTILIKKRLQYMILLILIFLGCFAAFCYSVYQSASTTLYEEVDRGFSDASKMIRENIDSSIENFLAGRNIVYTGNGSHIINYRMFIVMREEQGPITNAPDLTPFADLPSLSFSPEDAGRTLNKAFYRNGQKLIYRTHTLEAEDAHGTVHYIQLATDVTDIAASLVLIRDSLLKGMVIVLVVSVAASWFIVHLLVRAMTDAWDKQDEFISFASHELRSPLAVIHNSLELLLQNPGDRILDHSELVLQSLSGTSRLRRMTSDMLSMDSLQSAEMHLNYDLFRLEDFVRDYAEPYLFQAESGGKTLQIRVTPGLSLWADKKLIGQLLGLLLENAVKYTEEGDAIVLAVTGGENEVTISVKDTGIGISEEAMDKVFTRFYRDEKARATKDGSGLGLYIASLITERHRGRIKVRRNQPKGTEFLVTLPNRGISTGIREKIMTK